MVKIPYQNPGSGSESAPKLNVFDQRDMISPLKEIKNASTTTVLSKILKIALSLNCK